MIEMNQKFLCIPVILLIIIITYSEMEKKKNSEYKTTVRFEESNMDARKFFLKLNNYGPKVFLSHQCDSTNETFVIFVYFKEKGYKKYQGQICLKSSRKKCTLLLNQNLC